MVRRSQICVGRLTDEPPLDFTDTQDFSDRPAFGEGRQYTPNAKVIFFGNSTDDHERGCQKK